MKTELEIKDIYDVWYHPFWQQTWFIATGIVVCLFLIGWLSYWLYQKQKKPIIFTPVEVAIDQLQQLQKQKELAPKQFYTFLTTILKQFLQAQTKLHFVGTTDAEMLKLLEKNPAVPENSYELVKSILAGVTLIKFANQEAAESQMSQAIKSSFELVNLFECKV